jgi:MarR family transcriptional regulator, organic hydroperoxide resistance regulator
LPAAIEPELWQLAKEADLASNLMRAARLCRHQRSLALAQLGLFPGQDDLLKSLAESDGQSMGSLAGNLGVRPPTITKMVSRMAAQGLLRRQNSAHDNRQNHVFLTDSGAALLDEVDKRWRQCAVETFGSLTDKEEKRLRKILSKILTEPKPAKRRR